MRFIPKLTILTFSALLGLPAFALGLPRRISESIQSSTIQVLSENAPLAASRGADMGVVNGDLSLDDMALHFNITPSQQAELSQLLKDQQNVNSPRYHQWLTPEEFRSEFGLSADDANEIVAWLEGQGFSNIRVARGGLFIRFSGTASEVEKAFHTPIHRVKIGGEDHFSNLTPPALPSEIAAVTERITGLDDLRPKGRKRVSRSDSHHGMTYTESGAVIHAVAPDDFYTIYDEAPLLANGINGKGVSIAVVGQSDVDLDNISDFRTAGGLPPDTPTEVLYGSDPGTSTQSADESESDLDLEWAGATAPGAHIIFANGLDALRDSLTGAIDDDLAPIISTSYGDCEAEGHFGQSEVNVFNLLFQMANAQGQTIVALSGDWGATSCDYDDLDATQGLSVLYPASSPFVTGIGGTSFDDQSGTYWLASNGPYAGSAISYIPESAWNQSAVGGTQDAGGGGVSRYFSKPFWQVGIGVPQDFSRDVPDISLLAGGQDSYVSCDNRACEAGYFGSDEEGTSFSAPAFAGILALVIQRSGGRIGNANPTLYALANSKYYETAFHDVIDGSNASSCIAGTVDCPYGGSIGYVANVGYDLVTGWGSVDVSNFVNDWQAVSPLSSSTGEALTNTMLTATPNSVAQGSVVNLIATISSIPDSSSGIPSGSVQFLVDNVPVGQPVPLAGGDATFSLNTATLNGYQDIEAVYLGDSEFESSKGTSSVTIKSSISIAQSITSITALPSTVTLGNGAMINATVAPSPGAASPIPTGSVQFSLNNANFKLGVPILLQNGQAILRLEPSNLPNVGSFTIFGAYFGDDNYSPSQSSVVVAVTNPTPPSPDFTLSPASTSVTIKSGGSGEVQFLASSLNGFTGSVKFTTSVTNASFSVNPVTVDTQTPGSTTLTIYGYTVTQEAVSSRLRSVVASTSLAGAVFICFWPIGRRRFVMKGVLSAVLFSAILISLSGCGSGSETKSSPPGNQPISPGLYNVEITATGMDGAATVTHTALISLTIQ